MVNLKENTYKKLVFLKSKLIKRYCDNVSFDDVINFLINFYNANSENAGVFEWKQQ